MLCSLWFGAESKVQNFELYALFEKCFNNKRFIEKRRQRLIIMNLFAVSSAANSLQG
jgi:hypothetical protein